MGVVFFVGDVCTKNKKIKNMMKLKRMYVQKNVFERWGYQ